MRIALDYCLLCLLCGGFDFGGLDDMELSVFIMWMREKKNEERRVHSHLRKHFFHLISEEEIKEEDECKLLYSGIETSFITATGFDTQAFHLLHEKIECLYMEYTMFGQYDYTIKKVEKGRGQKRAITSENCLGPVLMWTRTRGLLWPLTLIFGIFLYFPDLLNARIRDGAVRRWWCIHVENSVMKHCLLSNFLFQFFVLNRSTSNSCIRCTFWRTCSRNRRLDGCHQPTRE
eukprot:4677194-Ditylum_brightwellii.AAC.1